MLSRSFWRYAPAAGWVMLRGEFRMSSSVPARYVAASALVLATACGGAAPPAESAERTDSADRDDARPLTYAAGKAERALQDELTPGEVVIKLRGNETDIRRCFFANPTARGTLSLVWNVNAEGRIEHLKRARSTLSDPRIEQCLAEKLYDLHFDPRAKPARAGWTFVFRLVEPKKDRLGNVKRSSKRDRDRAERGDQGVELEKGSPGQLDLGQVDNVVESGFPLFARCYRDGVSRNSSLDGAVRLRFVVGEAGHVTTVEDGGSDLTDRQVVDCVAESFYALRFPEPASGDAHLVYRIHFDAG
jgi:hypothetical protein